MPTIHTDADPDVSHLTDKPVAVIGYGDQGRAHALNLADSGIDVLVGLPPGSASRQLARGDGMSVGAPAEVAAEAAVVSLLVPDGAQPAVFDEIRHAVHPGDAIQLAHGRAALDGAIDPASGVDVSVLRPAGSGALVRRAFTAGRGIPGLMAVHRDHTGEATDRCLAYAGALGCTRAVVVETTLREVTEAARVAEAAVPRDRLAAMVTAGFEALTDAGHSPAVAYLAGLTGVGTVAGGLVADGLDGRWGAESADADHPMAQTGAHLRDHYDWPATRTTTDPTRHVRLSDGGTDRPEEDRRRGRRRHVPPHGMKGAAGVWERGGESLGYDPEAAEPTADASEDEAVGPEEEEEE